MPETRLQKTRESYLDSDAPWSAIVCLSCGAKSGKVSLDQAKAWKLMHLKTQHPGSSGWKAL